MKKHFSRWVAPGLVGSLLLLNGVRSSAWAYPPGPEATVVSPDGSRVYVGNSASQAIEVIDTATNQRIAGVPLAGAYYVPGLAISPDGRLLYATTLVSDELLIIDTATLKVAATVKVGLTPAGVALSPDAGRLYVALQNPGAVTVIDIASRKTAGTVRVGREPNYLAVSPDGQRVYVTNTGMFGADSDKAPESVSVIDATGIQLTATIPVGAWPEEVAVNPDGKQVYVTHATVYANQVEVVDTTANQVVATIKQGLGTGVFPVGVAVSPDGKQLYVGSNDRLVRIIDTSTRQVTASIRVGDGPFNLAVTPDGSRLYVANKFSRTVSVIDTTTLQVATTVKMGEHPMGQ